MAWSPNTEELVQRTCLKNGASTIDPNAAIAEQDSNRTEQSAEELILSWNEQTYALRVQRRSATSRDDGLFTLEVEIPERMLLSVFAKRCEVKDHASPHGTTPRQAPSLSSIASAATPAMKSPTLEETERAAVVRALLEADGNLMQTTASLGIARSTLYLKLKKYNLEELVTRLRSAELPSDVPLLSPPVDERERQTESPTSLSA